LKDETGVYGSLGNALRKKPQQADSHERYSTVRGGGGVKPKKPRRGSRGVTMGIVYKWKNSNRGQKKFRS